jgi:FkbM family methyltransferase
MARWKRIANQLDVLALVCGAAFLGWSLAGGAARLARAPGEKWLEAAYGADRHSRDLEELIIRDFFNDRRAGFFLDVGSGRYEKGSNTYFLEKLLGWRGIAIDAQPQFAADYKTHRPGTKFFSFFISDVSDAVVDFYVVTNDLHKSTGERKVADMWQATKGLSHETVKVHTITLDRLLEAEQVDRVDFLSMDIEMYEPQALAGFDITRYRPALVCIEAHPPVQKKIAAYFAAKGYKRLEKYVAVDPLNWYYTPLTIHPD